MAEKEKVLIREVGLREGLQFLKRSVPVAQICELVAALNSTGVRAIELTSLVRPDRIPQMADADSLIAAYPRRDGIMYTALYLNRKGFERGEESNRLDNSGWLYASASETFFKKNYNRTLEGFLADLPAWKAAFTARGKALHGVLISAAFGCAYEGAVSEAALFQTIDRIMNGLAATGMDAAELMLADTVGHATPPTVRSVVSALQDRYPGLHLGLHVHDTRGVGIASVQAGLDTGVRIFEASLGGLGGCPFAPGARGNVATEEVVYLCAANDLDTGIDLHRFCLAVKEAERILGEEAIESRFYRAWKMAPQNCDSGGL